jgi:hypothetical protein
MQYHDSWEAPAPLLHGQHPPLLPTPAAAAAGSSRRSSDQPRSPDQGSAASNLGLRPSVELGLNWLRSLNPVPHNEHNEAAGSDAESVTAGEAEAAAAATPTAAASAAGEPGSHKRSRRGSSGSSASGGSFVSAAAQRVLSIFGSSRVPSYSAGQIDPADSIDGPDRTSVSASDPSAAAAAAARVTPPSPDSPWRSHPYNRMHSSSFWPHTHSHTSNHPSEAAGSGASPSSNAHTRSSGSFFPGWLRQRRDAGRLQQQLLLQSGEQGVLFWGLRVRMGVATGVVAKGREVKNSAVYKTAQGELEVLQRLNHHLQMWSLRQMVVKCSRLCPSLPQYIDASRSRLHDCTSVQTVPTMTQVCSKGECPMQPMVAKPC